MPQTHEMTRLTVDLPSSEYQALKMVAAGTGQGTTISSLVREMVHDFLTREDSAAAASRLAARRHTITENAGAWRRTAHPAGERWVEQLRSGTRYSAHRR